MQKLKHFIKSTIHALGLEIHRYQPAATKAGRLMATMQFLKIDTVFDVGANEGQFGLELRDAGFRGRIISFEPINAAHQALTRRSSHDACWTAHPRCALGAQDGEIELNIAGNSVSSSVLPMLAAHSDAAPQSVYQSKELVTLTTLDAVAPQYCKPADQLLLKIDTQGYEWAVLDGAQQLLPQAKAVLIELSLLPLYEGQHLWRECIERLEKLGFTLWAAEPAFTDPSNGRTMQLDGLFVRV